MTLIGKNEKLLWGTPGSTSGEVKAGACTPGRFFTFTTHRENKVMRLSKKVRDTQQDSHYSTKNNVSMFMIPFMAINIEYAIFNYSKQNKRHLCSKRHTYRQTHGLTENGMTKQNMVDVSSR